MSLSLTAMHAGALEAVQTIKRGKPAPYTGVLLPDDEFRYYKERELFAQEIDKALINEPVAIPRELGFIDVALPFLLGSVFTWGVLSAIQNK